MAIRQSGSGTNSTTRSTRPAGSPTGPVNQNLFFNGIPDTIENNLKYLDVIGSIDTHNHYPTGWAQGVCAPFKMYKRYVWNGGICDPLIVSSPDKLKATANCATSTATSPTPLRRSTTCSASSSPTRSSTIHRCRSTERASSTPW